LLNLNAAALLLVRPIQFATYNLLSGDHRWAVSHARGPRNLAPTLATNADSNIAILGNANVNSMRGCPDPPSV
jgi:hypothetical protein